MDKNNPISRWRGELYGISALMIVAFHSSRVIPYPFTISFLCAGVDVFAFLSGMSLSYAMAHYDGYAAYARRRLSRVFIPYLLCTLPFWIWFAIAAHADAMRNIFNFTGLSLFVNHVNGHLIVSRAIFWFVHFILVMYAVYPALFKLQSRRTRSGVLAVTATLIAVCAGGYFLYERFSDTISFQIEFARLPAFLLGSYVGVTAQRSGLRSRQNTVCWLCLIPLSVGLFLVARRSDNYIFTRYLYSALAVFAIPLIAFAFDRVKLPRLKRVLRFFGEISLEMYLTHYAFVYIIEFYWKDILTTDRFTTAQKVLLYAGVAVLTVPISWLFRHLTAVITKRIDNRKKQKPGDAAA